MSRSMSMHAKLRRTCFVTIGATASFSGLIKAVVCTEFLDALRTRGYETLLVQYGKDGQVLFDSCLDEVSASAQTGIKTVGFDLDKNGLAKYMMQAKSGEQGGVVISHAGSGTILDALRLSVVLIVVPNAELLDNHQVELAEVLAAQEYVVHGRLDGLVQALDDAETLRQRQKTWPPPNSGVHRPTKGLKDVLDEEMGFLD